MSNKIPIETSARHLHISQEDFEVLFGRGSAPTFKKKLSQPGQYLCQERITVVGPRGEFKNMALLGPVRKETQVEIALTDARKLGIESMIRQSGDLEGTPGCTLIGPEGSLTLTKGVIVSKRHIHMSPSDALHLHVKDNESVFVLTQSYERALIYADVIVRVHPDFRLSMHVDTDEANAFAGDDSPYGVIVKLFDSDTYNMQMWVEEVLEGIHR